MKDTILDYIIAYVFFTTGPHFIQYTEWTVPTEQVSPTVLIFIVQCMVKDLIY